MVRWESESYSPVVHFPEPPIVLDLSSSNPYGSPDSIWTVGRYNEVRGIYNTPLFSDGRTVHVGIDLGGPVGTPVHAFMDGVIHAAGYNAEDGDYGHTVVIHHQIDGTDVWALFGHLDEDSTIGVEKGMQIHAGDVIGHFGNESENGGWPPHVHIQLSLIEPQTHDLPGVVHPDEREWALSVFPDPQHVLGILY